MRLISTDDKGPAVSLAPIPKPGPLLRCSFKLPLAYREMLDDLESAFHQNQPRHANGRRWEGVRDFIVMEAIEKLHKDPIAVLKRPRLKKSSRRGIIGLAPAPAANPKEG